ncbi:hypothetical protein [Sulfitobacter pacificus]|uniref:Uncharacterized protein n=1 Tax=Sulfitobacter pacificus TaxID=1499314 RepID=A0ABQ5VNC6_9RHOB|nr:hypothetical protein [Sulfitobacter pacificus]GLQ28572.1 hypothetical protein GCM10007927_33750 [Sulfitobacter pacificus]
MDQQEKFAREPSETADGRAVSQIVFVLIGMAIIVGGIWTLYMGNAPYHPQDEVTRESTPLIGS